jgi:hypothetical protein
LGSFYFRKRKIYLFFPYYNKMNLNKKHILIGSLIILSVMLILAVIYSRNSETYKDTKQLKNAKSGGPRNAKAGVVGTTTVKACSITDNNTVDGNKYRNFACTDPTTNTAVDPQLCGITDAELKASLTATCRADPVSAPQVLAFVDPGTSNYEGIRYDPIVLANTNIPISDIPACAYEGYQFNQKYAWTCVDTYDNNKVYPDSTCTTNGLAKPVTSTVSVAITPKKADGTTGLPVCTPKASNTWIGWQFYHYVMGGTALPNAMFGATNLSGLKMSTKSSTLLFPPNASINTVSIPAGLAAGAYIMILIYYMDSTNANTMGISVSSTSSGITPIQTGLANTIGSFQNAINNSTSVSKSMYYFVYPFTLAATDPATPVRQTITVSAAVTTGTFKSNVLDDLFLIPLNNTRSYGCNPSKQPGFQPSTCLLGNLPFMAQYRFTGLAGGTGYPFGGTSPSAANPVAPNPIVITDNIGLTLTNSGTGTVNIGIPAVSGYNTTPFSNINGLTYMLIIQWKGTAPGSAGTLAGVAKSESINAQAYPILAYSSLSSTTGTNAVLYPTSGENVGTWGLFYYFALQPNAVGSIAITPTSAGLPTTSSADLLLIQTNMTW